MTEQEAKAFLADRGPWNVTLEDYIVFENESGDVLTLELWVEQGYPNCLDDIIKEFTKGKVL